MTEEPLPFSDDDVADALAEVRRIAHGLPSVTERPSHGAPTFFIGDRRSFVMFHADHHGDGRLALWCAAPDGVQALMVEEDPRRFFVPAYVGHRGWLGVRLDVEVDWDEVASVVEDAYRAVAPARLRAQLDAN
ncbi:MAG: MmcQ/YjbR family DNA-binding protein [Microthrixaceae bacterium]